MSYYRKTRKQRNSGERDREEAEALARIQDGTSTANHATIISGFTALGIPAEDIKPRENVLTYAAWRAKGRQVSKGQHGVKVSTVIEKETTDAGTGETKKESFRRRAVVFHITQTYERNGNAPTATPQPSPTASPAPTSNHTLAASLRGKADAMQPYIDKRLDPAIGRKNQTQRRAGIAASMRDDAHRAITVQTALRSLANAHDAGTCPYFLWHIRHKSEVERLLNKYDSTSTGEIREWFQAREMPRSADDILKDKITEAERELIGQKIPGFFPTPKTLIDRMLRKLDIHPGDEVLEPSAGKGDIADAIRETHPDAKLQLIEVNSQLCDLLTLKGFIPYQADFLQAQGECDKIAMNPPFEKGQDIEHVRHAYGLLRPCGRLVAIMSTGPFFRKDKKSVAFMKWLEEIDAFTSAIDADAFSGPESFRQTGVRTIFLTINKGNN